MFQNFNDCQKQIIQCHFKPQSNNVIKNYQTQKLEKLFMASLLKFIFNELVVEDRKQNKFKFSRVIYGTLLLQVFALFLQLFNIKIQNKNKQIKFINNIFEILNRIYYQTMTNKWSSSKK
ncbi:hypothetical protein ABPG74_002109 [Tetrahymena malaccensis]